MEAIYARDVVKRFGESAALDGLDLSVAAGTVLGLLGPNGAGKTTAVRILTTLLKPDAGTVRVAGLDVVGQADLVRRSIGLSGQYAAVDEQLTGRENLVMFARLHRLRGRAARALADELLGRFRLEDAADRVVRTYSGGMRRRLDLAGALITRPKVIFLDEPTTGLDVQSRLDVWETVRGLVSDGAALLLTTQYLEEADTLADDILILNRGRTIARGTPDELKASVGGELLELSLLDQGAVPLAEAVLRDAAVSAYPAAGADPAARRDGPDDVQVDVQVATRTLTMPVRDGVRALAEVSAGLARAGVAARGLSLRRPTMDEVFLALTSDAADGPSPDTAPPDEPSSDEPSPDEPGRAGDRGLVP
ncbi:daunorubicin/doxorubicin resistance ABC transporter ATP-binding protein DrrA [Actinomadura sp. CNU-125]|uniref:ATP-binding cassette domain-containing protein n=1 Tax=Actinomadura sp. CNU-125 TaxID=1904961 RepID=UPI000962A311|nr:ATP-binding cassette domain-containing protein [Actinomadura sp. CNU-125]OLT25796.1 daunorubicin/doxorubicin resistance ABC transporter ATP-binding protein DrrA [Actinomadura sp. CNU-125]